MPNLSPATTTADTKTMLPFVIELQDVDAVRARLTYTLYFLDRTTRTVQGTLDDLEAHLQEAQQCRELGYRYSGLLAQQTQLQRQLETLQQQIQTCQTQLPELEQAAAAKRQQVTAETPKPEYDARLAGTLPSGKKQGLLIATLVGAGFGLLVFATSEGGIGRFIGGSLLLGGSISAGAIYGQDTDDSADAAHHRQLKQQADAIDQRLASLERENQSDMQQLRSQLHQAQTQQQALEQQKAEIDDLLPAALLIHQATQALGDGLVYGKPDLMASLELLIQQRQKNSEAARELAGAAAVGLLVLGAFTGLNF